MSVYTGIYFCAVALHIIYLPIIKVDKCYVRSSNLELSTICFDLSCSFGTTKSIEPPVVHDLNPIYLAANRVTTRVNALFTFYIVINVLSNYTLPQKTQHLNTFFHVIGHEPTIIINDGP